MTAQNLLALTKRGAAVVGLVLAPSMTVLAQPPGNNYVKTPGKDATYIMIPVFKATGTTPAEKNLGTQAANAMRERVDQDFPSKEVYVIPTTQIDGQLQASGFSTTEALLPHDATALAKILRAGEYIDGQVTKNATGITATVNVVLARDNKLVQPLGTFTAPKMGDVMSQISKEYKEARKQLPGELKCVNAARDNKYAEAMTFARAAIALYPKATLARICMANVFVVSKAPTDSILKITREIRAIDPKSSAALRLAANAYKDSVYQAANPSAQDSVVTALIALLGTDPSNSRLQTEVIYEMGKGGNMKAAREFADGAVKDNPGDPELLKMRWLLLFTTRDYKEMAMQGEELVKLDTAFADSVYFKRTALAYSADSQPQKAAEAAARGLAKFSSNAELASIEIAMLQKSGQLQQALDKLDKAEAAKLAIENAGQLRISLLQGLKRDNEVLPVIRGLVAKGDTASALRLFVIKQGGDLRTSGQTAKDTAIISQSLAVLAYADSISKGDQKVQAQFQLGASNVVAASTKVGLAQADKANACVLWKQIKNHLVDAQIQLPAGGKFNPDIMRQLMGNAMQTDQYADQQITALRCK